METALLDTCCLYGDTWRDVLLRMAEADLYGPLWSEPILDELRRNLCDAIGDDRAARVENNLRQYFPDSIVTGFEHLTDTMTNHWKDRHVLAAAVHSEATVLVTDNAKDFPAVTPVTNAPVMHPDKFLLRLFHADPATVVKVLQQKVKEHRREPKTMAGLLAQLEHVKLPEFAQAVRRYVNGETVGA